jgi:hypothetical protein
LHDAAPPQHACPDAPQGAHMPAFPIPAPWQDRPDSQALVPKPVQHAPPFDPHAVHIDVAVPPSVVAGVVVQRVPEAVQVPPPTPPPQQGSPTAPQFAPAIVWHDPFVHMPLVPPPMQVAPLAMHIPPVQQPPPVQVLAGQQAWPVPPQLAPAAPPAPATAPPAPLPLRPPRPPLTPPRPVDTPPPPPAPLGVLLPPPQAAKPSEKAVTMTRNRDLTSPPAPQTICACRFSMDQISRRRKPSNTRGPRGPRGCFQSFGSV